MATATVKKTAAKKASVKKIKPIPEGVQVDKPGSIPSPENPVLPFPIPMATISEADLKELNIRLKYADGLITELEAENRQLKKRPDFFDIFKTNLKTPRFQKVYLGPLRQMRSVFPKEICDKAPFHIDRSTNVETAQNAVAFRLVPDEYVRQILWTFNELYKESIVKHHG